MLPLAPRPVPRPNTITPTKVTITQAPLALLEPLALPAWLMLPPPVVALVTTILLPTPLVVSLGNLTGSSTQGGVISAGRHDNNLTSNRESNLNTSNNSFENREHAAGVIDGVGGEGKNELPHREGESGDLPKALTEDKSKFVPMSSSQEHLHRNDNHHEGKIDAEQRKMESTNTNTNTAI